MMNNTHRINNDSMLGDLLKHTKSETSNVSNIFLKPYYSLIREKIDLITPHSKLYSKEDVVENITFQVVSYAYTNYFKYIYPYEFRLAKDNGLLKGVSEEEKNIYFINHLSVQSEWVEYCFEKYPKLLNLLDIFSKGIVLYIKDLLTSLNDDYDHLNTFFRLRGSKIDTFRLFLGDLHDGKCVSSIVFDSGTKLYYKPRGATNEQFLSDTLSFLNGRGLNVRLGIPPFLGRRKHSWHLHINHKDIENANSIGEYYNNLGKIQGLFYLLGTQDVIPDNVICVGNCPYIIDCESIAAKPFQHHDSTKLSMYLQDSVLQTGILPDWMFNNADERNNISSVLFEFGSTNYHLPCINGKPYPINEKTLRDFKNGFIESCEFVTINKMVVFDFLNNYDYKMVYSRVLLHPTIIYSFVCNEMVTPPYLHGSKTIQELIEPIVRSESYGILRSHLIKSIEKQIEAGNIPYFYITLYGNSLYTLTHKVVVNNWICSDKGGFSVIIERLSCLTKKRIQEQLCIMDEAVNFFLDVRNEKTRVERIRPIMNGLLNRKDLLLAINRIDLEIRKRMIEVENEIGFVCRTRNSYNGKFQVCLMNDSLYDGLLGVCLFYRSLYNYSLNQRHKTIADGIFKQLCGRIHEAYKDIEKVKVPISPLTGITGKLYLMERYPEYYDGKIYASIIEEVEHLLQITTQYDYMSGLTGLILFIAQCKLIDEEKRFNILRGAGERLVKLANNSVDGKVYWTYVDGNRFVGERNMVLGGFAHGSSSISIALYTLFQHLKEQKYYDLFRQALSHDRSFYSDEIRGWIDGRDLKSKQDSGSWCHGATGIALSRLILKSEGFTDVVMRKELAVSFKQIERRIGYNLCVCHGTMGNLEVLNALAENTHVNSCCINWLSSIVNHINTGKDIICGDNNRNSQVCLFMGFAGIGYQLLRFYDWEQLPRILCLEISPIIDSLHENKRKPKSLIE